jgi:hypothetical protein
MLDTPDVMAVGGNCNRARAIYIKIAVAISIGKHPGSFRLYSIVARRIGVGHDVQS